jgi:hypothetical protein
MPIIAEKSSSNYVPVDAGTHLARCISMIEIGTVEENYKGTLKRQKKVWITWELPTELAVFNEEKGEEPYTVSKKYTLSMSSKANLRHDLEAWRGMPYKEEEVSKVDITKLLGQPCLLTVIHEPAKADPSKIYANIANISKLMKGQTCPKQITPTKILCYDKFDWEVFSALPDYLKDQIKKSEEFAKLQEPGMVGSSQDEGDGGGDGDDDAPPF